MDVGRAQNKREPSLLLIISAMVVACSGTTGTESTTSSVTTTIPSTATTSPSATSTTFDTEGEGPLYLRHIDGTTLKDLPGEPRLGIGRDSRWALSDDGRWLVLATSKTPQGGNHELRLVDTHSWSWSSPITLSQSRLVHSLAVTNEGTIVWMQDPHDRLVIHRLPLGVEQPEQLYTFESDRWPVTEPNMPGALTEASLTLFVHDLGWNHGGFASILQVDLETGMTTEIDLPSVWHGGVRPEAGEDGLVAPTLYPGWTFDRERNLLYVVPADRDELMVVDLNVMEVATTATWSATESLLDRLVVWWIPRAHAKDGDFTKRHLTLSPDGSTLLVATQQSEAGSIVSIAIEKLEVIASRDFSPQDVVFSPDGSRLVAIPSFQPDSETASGGVHLLDPLTLETVEVVLPDLSFLHANGFSPDGSHVYASSYVPNSEAVLHTVIDLADPRVVAIRKVYWPGFAIPQAGVLAAADR